MCKLLLVFVPIFSLLAFGVPASQGLTDAQCKKYKSEIKKINELDDEGERFVQKELIERVLKTLKVEANNRVHARNIEQVYSRLPKITIGDIELLFSGVGECHTIIGEFEALKGLLGSLDHFKVSEKTRTRATKLTLDFVRNRSAIHGGFLEQDIYLALLTRLSDANLIKQTDTFKKKIKTSKKDAERRKKKLRKYNSKVSWPNSKSDFENMKKKDRENLFASFRHELEFAEKSRKRVIALVSEITAVQR